MATVRLEGGDGQSADFRPRTGARARHGGDIASGSWGRPNDSADGTSHLSLKGPREREAVAGTLGGVIGSSAAAAARAARAAWTARAAVAAKAEEAARPVLAASAWLLETAQ